jgi:hypothetical protein
MKKLLVLSLVLLMACSTTNHYLKPDVTKQDFDRDYKTCFWDSSPSLWLQVPAALFFSPAEMVMAQKRDAKIPACMQARGYTVDAKSGYTP